VGGEGGDRGAPGPVIVPLAVAVEVVVPAMGPGEVGDNGTESELADGEPSKGRGLWDMMSLPRYYTSKTNGQRVGGNKQGVATHLPK
jgi:hypothetical protein